MPLLPLSNHWILQDRKQICCRGKQEVSQWDEVVPLPLEKFPLVFPSGSINILNNYGPHDSETPLQFLYEAAECRPFFTVGNILN